MMITLGVMGIVNADLAAGIRQQQAVQVFNIAEAGVHYAIARLQGTGGGTYSGGTVPITDGTTTLRTAQVVVQCLGGTDPSINACTGLNPGLRRIVSTGSLPSGGATRVVTAIVEGTDLSHQLLCRLRLRRCES
jgi:hypothetical protein